MEEMQNKVGTYRSARRRLIKGSFAAPAALTLCSGSAFARTSSQCVANAARAGNMPDADSSASWLRLQALSYVPAGSGMTTSYWIQGSDILALATASGVGLSPAGWITSAQNLCVAAGSADSGPDYVLGTLYPTGTPPTLAPSTRFYAVLVDPSGNLTGISNAFGSGGAVHQTCWSSFIAP